MKLRNLLLIGIICMSYSCATTEQQTVDTVMQEVVEQLSLLLQDAERVRMNPRTVNKDGCTNFINPTVFDWTEGFFPGSLWYLYEYTGDDNFKQKAEYFQNLFYDQRVNPYNHDLGFLFNTSYGNAYRITKDEQYKETLISASDALITRFDSRVGLIKSWNADKGWQAKRGWKYPVIIDNMMNLELLFKASELSGNEKYKNIAIAHADMTLKNHFRKDNSSYHVVDYDSVSSQVRSKQTAQGYAHESVWARGQAWGFYGYVMCYRYTQEPRYLDMAEKIADFIIRDTRIPADKIPYWDYDAPKIPNEPRDASAAACTASALLELVKYSEHAEIYLSYAKELLKSLSSDNYRAQVGTNNHFILKHCVGSVPHNTEVDVPFNFADYYYIEAMLRLRDILD